jgi:hypothetical protein
VAADPLEPKDDFVAVVERVRGELAATGEDKVPIPDEYVSPLGPTERDAIMRLLRDGTYRRAAARVGEQDPDVADH